MNKISLILLFLLLGCYKPIPTTPKQIKNLYITIDFKNTSIKLKNANLIAYIEDITSDNHIPVLYGSHKENVNIGYQKEVMVFNVIKLIEDKKYNIRIILNSYKIPYYLPIIYRSASRFEFDSSVGKNLYVPIHPDTFCEFIKKDNRDYPRP